MKGRGLVVKGGARLVSATKMQHTCICSAAQPKRLPAKPSSTRQIHSIDPTHHGRKSTKVFAPAGWPFTGRYSGTSTTTTNYTFHGQPLVQQHHFTDVITLQLLAAARFSSVSTNR
mgnify:CR=1 FL=1